MKRISMQIGTSGPRATARNDQLHGPGGQRSRSQEAQVKFGGVAEVSFSTPLGRVGFVVSLTLYGQNNTAQQRTIIQQYGDWYTGR